jgi:hypothetical protein
MYHPENNSFLSINPSGFPSGFKGFRSSIWNVWVAGTKVWGIAFNANYPPWQQQVLQ